jgi:transposase
MEDGALRMSMREHLRYQVCGRMLRGEISEVEAAGRLGLSVRQARRLKKRVLQEGAGGVVHRLRGRRSARRVGEEVEGRIRELYEGRYAGWNVTHFVEKLGEEHGITVSREKARQVLMEEASRPRRGRRRRHRRWRARRGREGELVQMDASIQPWLGRGGEEAVLISAVDDATGKMLWGEFFASDGTLENLSVMRGVVRRHGIPGEIYLDRSSKYFATDEAAAAARQRGGEALTQFGRAMKELGVRMVKAGSPQAKGRIERSFKTLQDRLVKELALEGIKTRREANEYLRKVFVPCYNARFGREAREKKRAFVKAGRGLDYRKVFCVKAPRQVQNDYTISYEGEKIQLEDSGLYAGQKVEVRVWLDGSVHVYRKDRPVRARKVARLAG